MLSFQSLAAAAVAIMPLVSATPINQEDLVARNNVTEGIFAQAAPKLYEGPYTAFPGKDSWKSFDALYKANSYCLTANGNTKGDGEKIKVAVQAASKKYSIPEAVIFAIIIQESSCDVGVKTTMDQEVVANAGLMQCRECAGFPGKHGLTQEQISSMVDGGTKHFAGNLKSQGGKNTQPVSVYPALREYNSGRVNKENLSDGLGATPAYVSDVVQRLGGWVG